MSERLTPEVLARECASGLWVRSARGHNADMIAAAIRSALAQQAQEWRWAVKDSVREFHCELDEDPCNECAPLRALMKED